MAIDIKAWLRPIEIGIINQPIRYYPNEDGDLLGTAILYSPDLKAWQYVKWHGYAFTGDSLRAEWGGTIYENYFISPGRLLGWQVKES